MKNNGWTLIELLGVIVLISIIFSVAVISVNYIIQNSKIGVYHNYETTLKGAAENYFIDNIDDLPDINGYINLHINDLENYLDELKDPNGGNCNESFVKVTRGNNIANNFNLNYQVCLICKLNGSITYSSDMQSDIKFCQ